jgi:hypothetical protein
MEVIDAMLVSGEISFNELTHDQKVEWASWEPEPPLLTSFSLADPEQRADFLYQYCWYGEPLLLAAVSHIWDSLAEPRELRCTLIGQACGAGGTGKMALVNMLNQMLYECSEIGTVMPDRANSAGPEDYHGAVMDHFSTMAEQERALCMAYGEILDGAGSAPVKA